MNQNLIIPLGAALAAKITFISNPVDVQFPQHQSAQAQFPWGTGNTITPGYNVDRFISHQGTPLSRSGFAYLTQLGNGVDDQGYYRSPFSTEQAFGTSLEDGLWRFPMQWEDADRFVLLHIHNAQVIRQDYQLQ